MEDIQSLVKEANKAFNTADHLTYVTYPLVNDVKLLLTVIDNLYLALNYGMEALLQYDKEYKRIGNIPVKYDDRLVVFKTKVAHRYNIEREHVILLMEINELRFMHEKSTVEFERKNKYIICTSDYKTKMINIDKVKEYMEKAKGFIDKVNKVLPANDRRFSG